MEKKNSTSRHIYYGLGTLSLVLIGATLLFKHKAILRSSKKAYADTAIDYSIFDSPDQPGTGRCIDRGLVHQLQQLEAVTGYPIFKWINSGGRTKVHNRRVGGVANSSHVIPICKAVDIKASSIIIRNTLVYAAKQVGFKRIGVGRTFVHFDVDTSKRQYVAWGYPKGAKAAVNPFV